MRRVFALSLLILLGLSVGAEAQFFPFFGGPPYGPPPQRRFAPPPIERYRVPDYNAPYLEYRRAPAPRAEPQQRVDYSHAPNPRETKSNAPTKILVMGDSMADWLGYGLEEAFSDTPEVGIVRKNRVGSGLVRYDSRNDSSWAQVARDAIKDTKPAFVVMMLGINDRTSIREAARQAASPASHATTDDTEAPGGAAAKEDSDQAAPADDSEALPAPESPGGSRARATTTIAFRADGWPGAYSRRIGETVAALKSAGVPVIWVGLPPLRGQRSTADMSYLNDLYRAAAEKAQVFYADVWDGFTDDDGKFALSGPDLEGQTRRLRTSDGVHFTKAGARKLAHFVEREVRRVMSNRVTPVALPTDEAPPETKTAPAARSTPAGPPPRPLVGRAYSLTGADNADELLGGGTRAPTDPARAALTKGETSAPQPGRADDFTWPRPSHVNLESTPGVEPPPEPQPTANARPADAGKGDAKEEKSAKAEEPSKPRTAPPARERRPAQQAEQRAPRPFSGFPLFEFFR